FEQTAILEAVADAPLERRARVFEPHQPRAHLLTVAADDALRLVGLGARHRNLDLPHRVDRHRPDGLRVAADAEALDAVAVEQRHYHAGLDVRRGVEDDDGRRRVRLAHAAAASTDWTRNSSMVMSSCCSAGPTNSEIALSISSRSCGNVDVPCD